MVELNSLDLTFSFSQIVNEYEADKTIKIWKKDESATEQTHPLNYKPPKDIRQF